MVCVVILGSIASFSHGVNAQVTGPTSIDGIDVQTDPAIPSPGQNVTISLTSYLTDLNKATISWIVDQNTIAKKVGLMSIQVPAPLTSKPLNVMAVIDTAEGAEVQKVVTVQSGDVDLLWETSGYVPPLYRGKAPFVYQNTLKIIADPHLVDASGQPLDPTTLVYTWKKDNEVLGSLSGYDAQTLTLIPDIIPRPFLINVDVSSQDSKVKGEASETFTPVSPSITFYEEDPLYGVLYNKAIGDTFQLIHKEVKILAVPYGFDVPHTIASSSSLVYTWSINGTSHDELSSSRTVVLGVAPGTQGSSVVDLSLQNVTDNILQGATAEFTALFDSSSQNTTNNSF